MTIRRTVYHALFAIALLGGGGAQASQGSLVMPTTGTISGLTFSTNISAALAALVTCNSGASAPSNATDSLPAVGQCWDDSSTTPTRRKVFDGASWLTIGAIDAVNHIWTPIIGGGASASLTSAATVDLCSVPQSVVMITGTATISSFSNNCQPNELKVISFSGIAPLTYNATSLILPGANDITTQAGDYAWARHIGGGNWAIFGYQRADGTAIDFSANFTSAVTYSGTISPTALAAQTDNWAPTGLVGVETIRVTLTGSQILTGLTGGAAGRQITIANIDAVDTLTIGANHASSSAANRFDMPFPISLTPGATQQFRYDGTTNVWRPLNLITNRTIAGAFKALKIVNNTGAPTTTMDITANALTLEDAAGAAVRLTGVSVSPVMTASGINGLDTGTIVNNTITWYAVYVFYNPTTGVSGGLYSLHPSCAALLAAGTNPSGYTFCMRVGYARTDGAATARWMRTLQYGRSAQYTVTPATNTTVYPAIATGTTSSTFTSVSIANVTPPSASRISVQFIGANDVCQIGPSNVTNANQLVRMTSTGIALALVSTMTVEGTTMAYYGSDSACSVKAVGWEDNL